MLSSLARGLGRKSSKRPRPRIDPTSQPLLDPDRLFQGTDDASADGDTEAGRRSSRQQQRGYTRGDEFSILEDEDAGEEGGDEDDDSGTEPLLPIFSAAHLGTLCTRLPEDVSR